MRIPLLALLALLLVSLAACGDTTTSGDGPGAGNQEGAATPEELIERLKALEDSDDMTIMIPLLHPDERGAMSFAMGVMMPQMMIGMGKQFAGMAGGGDPAKAKEAVAKFDAAEKAHAALLEKYKIGQTVEITILRNRQKKLLRVKLSEV